MSEPLAVASSTAAAAYPAGRHFKQCGGIKKDETVDLHGPLEVIGAVKSVRSIALEGDFVIHEKIDAYGDITMDGNVSCGGWIRAYGNISVTGYLRVSDRIQGYGKLKLDGMLEGTDLEVYGNLVIAGYLKCRRLLVYGSLTLIGPSSTYIAEVSEQVVGAKLPSEREADGISRLVRILIFQVIAFPLRIEKAQLCRYPGQPNPTALISHPAMANSGKRMC